MKAIFAKKIDPRCIYCARGEPLNVKESLCSKRGITDAYDRCSAFIYDPLKRTPPRPAKLGTDYTPEDFQL